MNPVLTFTHFNYIQNNPRLEVRLGSKTPFVQEVRHRGRAHLAQVRTGRRAGAVGTAVRSTGGSCLQAGLRQKSSMWRCTGGGRPIALPWKNWCRARSCWSLFKGIGEGIRVWQLIIRSSGKIQLICLRLPFPGSWTQ